MRKTLFLAIIAVIFTLASCQNDEDFAAEYASNDPIFTATIANPSSRTALDASTGKVSWEMGDEITVTDAASTSVKYTATAINVAGYATFTKKIGEEGTLGSGPYQAVFGSASIAEQIYSTAVTDLPMTATSSTTNLQFSVTCGLLEVNLAKAGESVKKIAVSDGTSTYTLTCTDAVSINEGAKFFIALPEGNYTTFKIINADGFGCKKSKESKSVAITKNHIKPISFTTMEFPKAELASADDFVDFMTNGSDTDKYTASCIVKLTSDINLSGKTLQAISRFAGTFDGQGHCIKDYTFNTPLFSIVTGMVKDLVIDTSCAFEINSSEVQNGASICGKLTATGSIQNCTNNANITCTGSDTGTCNYIGGIVGWNQGTISNCTNTAQVTGNVAHETLALGGIVGKNDSIIIFSGNSGKIVGPSTYTTTKYGYIGGIAGWTTKSLSDLTNEGEIATSTTGTGWGQEKGYIRAHGGIIGYAEDEITLNKLINKGNISYTQTTKKLGSGSILGGVIAYVNGPVTIYNCENQGYIYNNIFNNTYTPMLNAGITGGVVGAAFGSPIKNASISSCKNTATSGMACKRGLIGGICGWTKNVQVSGCVSICGTNATNENIAAIQGGIAANADENTIIDRCVVSSITLKYKPETCTCTSGGIAGKLLHSTSQITSCVAEDVTIMATTVDNEENCPHGGIAGTSVAGSLINACVFCGFYSIEGGTKTTFTLSDICSDTNFNSEGNNISN